MFIQTEATPNPSTLKFIPGRDVMPGGTLDIRDPEMAARSASMNVGVPTIKTPEQFRDVVAQDLQLWKKIVTDANITVEN